jgi:hypothetical protein
MQARGDVGQDGFIRYRASQQDCASCNLRQRSTANMPARKVARSIHEGARDLARSLPSPAEEGLDAVCASQAHPETGSIAVRGPSGTRDELLLAATPRTSARWPS